MFYHRGKRTSVFGVIQTFRCRKFPFRHFIRPHGFVVCSEPLEGLVQTCLWSSLIKEKSGPRSLDSVIRILGPEWYASSFRRVFLAPGNLYLFPTSWLSFVTDWPTLSGWSVLCKFNPSESVDFRIRSGVFDRHLSWLAEGEFLFVSHGYVVTMCNKVGEKLIELIAVASPNSTYDSNWFREWFPYVWWLLQYCSASRGSSRACVLPVMSWRSSSSQSCCFDWRVGCYVCGFRERDELCNEEFKPLREFVGRDRRTQFRWRFPCASIIGLVE